MTDDATPQPKVSPRIEGLAALAPTPRRTEERRLAAAMREVIEQLVSTTATTEELSSAADDLEALADVLRVLPAGQTYRGFAESANAGQETAGLQPGDPEWYAFFDHSPFIGLANPLSPPVHLEYRDDRIHGAVTFGSAYEGPPGCVHGGYIAAVFDELLGATQSLSGDQGMTAHLGIDYRRPTPLGVPLTLEGWFERREGRKIYANGAMYADGELTAEASGLFIAFDAGKFAALLAARDEG
ncbi:MAG: PaaI family thioesterase [Microthrixaceae bacterium]